MSEIGHKLVTSLGSVKSGGLFGCCSSVRVRKIPFFRVQEDFFATIFWVFPVKMALSRGKTSSVKSGGLFGCCSSVRVRKSTFFFRVQEDFFSTIFCVFHSRGPFLRDGIKIVKVIF